MNKIERLRVAHGRVLKARLVIKFSVIKSELMFHYTDMSSILLKA